MLKPVQMRLFLTPAGPSKYWKSRLGSGGETPQASNAFASGIGVWGPSPPRAERGSRGPHVLHWFSSLQFLHGAHLCIPRPKRLVSIRFSQFFIKITFWSTYHTNSGLVLIAFYLLCDRGHGRRGWQRRVGNLYAKVWYRTQCVETSCVLAYRSDWFFRGIVGDVNLRLWWTVCFSQPVHFRTHTWWCLQVMNHWYVYGPC